MLTIPPQYGYVLFTAMLLGLECLLIGFLVAGRMRASIFTEQYMKGNFGSQHPKKYGQIKSGGYPDNGSGLYSKFLSYEQWYEFNNAQRAHMNFVQWIASTLLFLLVAGLSYPMLSAIIGVVTIFGRAAYAIGYSTNGPMGRLLGALVNDAAVLGLFVLGIMSSCNLVKSSPTH